MSVVSKNVHAVSRQPPPMPIQLEEYSASPLLRCLAFGTIHSPAMEWKVAPFSILPCAYPAQLKDWFAAIAAIGRAVWRGADGMSRRARRRRDAARRTTKRSQTACHSLRFGHDSRLGAHMLSAAGGGTAERREGSSHAAARRSSCGLGPGLSREHLRCGHELVAER